MSDRISKGAREFPPIRTVFLDGDTVVVNLGASVLPQTSVAKLHSESKIKAKDRLWIMPPDRVSETGWEVEVLELKSDYCKVRLLATGEELYLTQLTILTKNQKPKVNE